MKTCPEEKKKERGTLVISSDPIDIPLVCLCKTEHLYVRPTKQLPSIYAKTDSGWVIDGLKTCQSVMIARTGDTGEVQGRCVEETVARIDLHGDGITRKGCP